MYVRNSAPAAAVDCEKYALQQLGRARHRALPLLITPACLAAAGLATAEAARAVDCAELVLEDAPRAAAVADRQQQAPVEPRAVRAADLLGLRRAGNHVQAKDGGGQRSEGRHLFSQLTQPRVGVP